MTTLCPICSNSAEFGRDRDYGDKKQIDCPRCGPFEISGTALAMWKSRIEDDELNRARLSHSIRTKTSRDHWLFVGSTNLDELINHPLPSVEEQLHRLVRWTAAQLRDDRLGNVSQPKLENLASIIGTVDQDRVKRLISYGMEQGVIASDDSITSLGVTPKGWSMIESPKTASSPNISTIILDTTKESPEVVKARCNSCGGDRKTFKRASHENRGSEDEISWSDTYEILECCGCGEISIRHKKWLSEWDQLGQDPVTGEPTLTPGIQITYWPPPTLRKKPPWADKLGDEELSRVMDETYRALNSGLIVLASIGTRTLLDRAMLLLVGDPKGGFWGKLEQMLEKGHIGHDEKEILSIITDAGSAAAHRGFAPNPEVLTTIVETVENFLHRTFILKSAANEVKTATPKKNPE